MIPVPVFHGQMVAVVGMARSGIAAARSLKEGGARVIVWDDLEAGRTKVAGEFDVVDPAEWDWSAMRAVVLSPGIPLTHPKPHPIVVAAKKHKVEVIGDIELFVRTLAAAGHFNGASAPPFFSQGPVNLTQVLKPNGNGNGHTWRGKAPLICITGTNGKSTTTALISHLLSCNGWDAQTGGNIGKAVLELAPPRENTIYVLELSSYQIDLTPSLKPNVAVLMNITPDHLDRHGGMAGYIASKRRIFARQSTADIAVVGVDTPASAETCTMLSRRGGPVVVPMAVNRVIGRGIYALDGILYDGLFSPPAEITDLKAVPSLTGAHNWENACAAYATVRGYVSDPRAIARAFASFPGLAHRMEIIGEVGKVRLVNDSKATNADAAEKALAAYGRDLFWIVGGRAKDGGIEALAPHFKAVSKAYLIGEAAEAFAVTLDKAGLPYEQCGTLDVATRLALRDAKASSAERPVVMFSPACASFDQFKDFEDRGNHFRRIVAELQSGGGAAEAA